MRRSIVVSFPRQLIFPASGTTIIGLGWKGLPGTNNLTYYEQTSDMEDKSFITSGPG
jgi:hypothetical protein